MREDELQRSSSWNEEADKPGDVSLAHDRPARSRHHAVSAEAADSAGRSPLFVGESQAVRSLWRDLRAFAVTPYPVVLIGRTGTGKTILAREIHALSARARGPFLSFPLTSVPEELRHAELSGSGRGSYTGATHDRVGALEAAHRGTLFLDELNHASLGLQQTLLTLLESKGVQRLGETHVRQTDVRFILASSEDLQELVRQRRFLEELLYRVDCLSIRVPELAERRSDILPMAHHFVDEALRELHRPFLYEFALELQQFLQKYPWPGNVRQLRSICRFLAVRLDEERALDEADLPMTVRDHDGSVQKDSVGGVRDVLDRAGGNKSKAARSLGISRTKIYRLLREDPRSGS